MPGTRGPSPLEQVAGLAQSCRMEYERTDDVTWLDEAEARWEALRTHPSFASSPVDFQAATLNEMGMVAHLRYRRSQQAHDLATAIASWKAAVTQSPEGAPGLCLRLANLGGGLLLRGEAGDAEEAERCLSRSRDEAPSLAMQRVCTIAVVDKLVDSMRWQADPAFAQQTADLCRAALALEPAEDRAAVALRDFLSRALTRLVRGRPEDPGYDELIRVEREALRFPAPSADSRRMQLVVLGTDLFVRYQRFETASDLKEAMARLEEALALPPLDAPSRVLAMNALALALHARYGRCGDATDLKRAIALWETVVEACTGSPEVQTEARANLAQSLVEEFEATGDSNAVERASALCLENMTALPPDAPDRAGHLDLLGRVFEKRYQASHQADDLEKAIAAGREAVALSKPDTPGPLVNLAVALKARAAQTGNLADLAEAIDLVRQGLASYPMGASARLIVLSNLAGLLRTRYDTTRAPEDLDEAIATAEESVRLSPSGSKELPWRLTNLGNCLADRYGVSSRQEDIDQAVSALQEAVALSPSDSPGRETLLNNLALGLHNRYRGRHDANDLDQAIEFFGKALERVAAVSPTRARILTGLAGCYKARHRRQHRPEDLDAGRAAFEKAVELANAVAPAAAVRPARAWCDWALERGAFQEAVVAGGQALAALEHMLAGQALQKHKEDWLMGVRGLGNAVAYAHAACGDLQQAVEVIEGGRARFLSGVLERDRRDLEGLCALGQQALLERYREASARWTALAQRMDGQDSQGAVGERVLSADSLTSELASARRDLDAAIEAIRTVPGYQDFFARLSFARIAALAEVPLVYLIDTAIGGMALVVHGRARPASTPEVEVVPLPQLTSGAVRRAVFGEGGAGTVGGYVGAYAARMADGAVGFRRWCDALDATTRWLWDAVMGPLLGRLAAADDRNTAKPGDPMRATLVPTGLLGLLPLHAAWEPAPQSPLGRSYAIDQIELRYTANARALAVAQERLRVLGKTTTDRLLLVSDPSPVSASALKFAREEAVAVARLWPPSLQTHRSQAAATHQEVCALLPGHDVLHYAGHAFADWAEPQRSGLLLANDEMLTVQQIQEMRLSMRLATLSACETGLPGVRLPDEVVGLPAALVEAGAAGVIASLWAVHDQTTARLIEHFCVLWRDPERHLTPAAALRLAQLALRDSAALHPYAWAAFTYTGACPC